MFEPHTTVRIRAIKRQTGPTAESYGSRAPRAGFSIWRLAPYLIPIVVFSVLALYIERHGRVAYPDPGSLNSARLLGTPGDHYRYVAMALHPFSSDPLVHDAPFCWRVLTPWLVHALTRFLPISVSTGFWLVTLAGLLGSTVALMWFMRILGVSREATIVGGLAFVLLAWATAFTLFDYMLVDPLSLALLVVSLACTISRRGPWLVLTLLVFAFQKETVILAAAFALLYAFERRDRKMLAWSLAGAIGSGIILAGLHIAIKPDAPYSLFAELKYVRDCCVLSPTDGWLRIAYSTGGAWGLLLPFAALQLVHAPRVMRSLSFLGFWAMATAQVAVSVNMERVVVYAFPVVIAAFAFEIDYLAARLRIPRWFLWAPVVLAQTPWVVETAFLASPNGIFQRTIGTLNLVYIDQALLGCLLAVIVWAIYEAIAYGYARVRPARIE